MTGPDFLNGRTELQGKAGQPINIVSNFFKIKKGMQFDGLFQYNLSLKFGGCSDGDFLFTLGKYWRRRLHAWRKQRQS